MNFWKKYPRICKDCQSAHLDRGAWMYHQYKHWLFGGSVEARVTHLESRVLALEQEAVSLRGMQAEHGKPN
jgi:hypothetical protein